MHSRKCNLIIACDECVTTTSKAIRGKKNVLNGLLIFPPHSHVRL